MGEKLSLSYNENVSKLNEILNLDTNFDIIRKGIRVAGRDACIYFIDGFLEEAIMEKLLEFFYKLKPEEMPETARQMVDHVVPYVEVSVITEQDDLIKNLLSGVTCLLIDGYDACIGLDCRSYPMRSVDEPSKDKALRGSKDGFVETLVFNTALIRRRIRSPKLTMEILTAGKTSQTDIVLCYMENRVDRKLLRELRGRINTIKLDSLTMNQESLAECIYERKWVNPFPKFKFTERPDAASAAILEGNIVVLVDNSPQAMIVPTSVFDIVEEADDYYFPPVTGSYLRLTRFLIAIITLLLTPTFLLLFQNPQWVPEWLAFIHCLAVPDPGADHRRYAAGGHQYSQHAQYALKRDSRHRSGTVYSGFRLVQRGNHDVYGFCSYCQLHPVQLRAELCAEVHASDYAGADVPFWPVGLYRRLCADAGSHCRK